MKQITIVSILTFSAFVDQIHYGHKDEKTDKSEYYYSNKHHIPAGGNLALFKWCDSTVRRRAHRMNYEGRGLIDEYVQYGQLLHTYKLLEMVCGVHVVRADDLKVQGCRVLRDLYVYILPQFRVDIEQKRVYVFDEIWLVRLVEFMEEE